jgi:3-hydroxyacyl-CoA dehydrogenase
MKRIRTAAVIGAGTMGAQIAAHLANAGLSVRLLDVSAEAARTGLERAKALKPDPFFTPEASARIQTGAFDDALTALETCDWVVEAIVEDLAAKRALLARIEDHLAPHAVVSTNTSGIPIASIAEGRSDAFRRRWMGTHFFNPPRYLHLLEIVPTAETDPQAVSDIGGFADRRLGKGIVIARDTPNFIANRLGLFGVMRTFEALASGEYTIEEIDAITGPAIGRPKSATFRTMDIAGIDVLAHVARNLVERLESPDDRAAFAAPPLVAELVDRGWIGAKGGRGFYWKRGDEILVLDPATMDYRPKQAVKLPSLDAARAIEGTPDRLRAVFRAKDKAGEFLRRTLGTQLVYAARVAPSIAHSIDDVDRAMRWGFGWELGPFETWDAIGVQDIVGLCNVDDPPPLLREALVCGRFRSARPGTGAAPASRVELVPPAGPGLEILRSAKDRASVVRRNAGASLVDLGDGVLAVEFHSKMNTIGGDAIQMIEAGIVEAELRHRALVVGNESLNFSAGANLMLVLLEAQEGNWDEVDAMVRAFQRATMAIKHANVPVVVAPVGLALGGGCELALHADRVQAAAETYMGLVEAGVGLIPAGGGTKEMLARAMESDPSSSDPLPAVRRVFETIGFGVVSTSAAHARRIGYLRDVDGVTMNRDRLIADAKQRALERSSEYVPLERRTAIRVGGEDLLAALKLGIHLAWRAGRISEHDAVIGRQLAWVLAGGSLPHAGTVTELHLLDLEREAFLSLCGERKTQERIAHTLKTGSPLRN